MTTSSGPHGAGPTGRSRPERLTNREITRLVVAGVALVLLVAFVIDNSQTVKVGFVFFSAEVSLIWVLIIAAVLGAGVDRLVIYLRARRRSRSARPPQI